MMTNSLQRESEILTLFTLETEHAVLVSPVLYIRKTTFSHGMCSLWLQANVFPFFVLQAEVQKHISKVSPKLVSISVTAIHWTK